MQFLMNNLQVLDLAVLAEHVSVQLFHCLFDVAPLEVEILDGVEEFVDFRLTGWCTLAQRHGAQARFYL